MKRPFPWLFGWKFWRRFLLVIACGVTALAIFDTEEYWRGRYAWTNYKQQMNAQGADLRFDDYVPPRVPNEENFAATPFLAPMFDFIPGTQHQRDSNAMARIYSLQNGTVHIQDHNVWTAGDFLDLMAMAARFDKNAKTKSHFPSQAEAAQYLLHRLRPIDPILDQLRAASARPYCRFNIDYDWQPEDGIVLPHLAVVKDLCECLDIRACSELVMDHPQLAAADVHLMFRLIDCVRSEPFMISQLVRAACLKLALQPVWEALQRHQFSEEQLAVIEKALAPLDFGADAERGAHAERAMTDKIFAELQKMSFRQRARNFDDIWAAGSSPLLAPKCWLYFEELNYNKFYNDELKSLSITNGIDPDFVRHNAQSVLDELHWSGIFSALLHHRIIAAIECPGIVNFEIRMCHAQDNAHMALIACSLEQYRIAKGEYPSDLSALAPQFLPAVPHDLILDRSFIYRPKAGSSNYTLYSVGWNKKDDNGAYPRKGLSTEEDGDWVWKQ